MGRRKSPRNQDDDEDNDDAAMTTTTSRPRRSAALKSVSYADEEELYEQKKDDEDNDDYADGGDVPNDEDNNIDDDMDDDADGRDSDGSDSDVVMVDDSSVEENNDKKSGGRKRRGGASSSNNSGSRKRTGTSRTTGRTNRGRINNNNRGGKAQRKRKTMEDDDSDDEDDHISLSSDHDDDDDEQQDEVEEEETGSSDNSRKAKSHRTASRKTPSGPTVRKSSRSNKFNESFREPTGTSIKDLFAKQTEMAEAEASKRSSRRQRGMFSSSEDTDDAGQHQVASKTNKGGTLRSSGRATIKTKVPKSPARHHNKARLKVHIDDSSSDSDASDFSSDIEQSSDDETGVGQGHHHHGDEPEPFKVQRIIAARSEPRRVWKEMCKNMNTSEIEYGSRWYQETRDDDDDDDDGEAYEERFLVKWHNYSFLHCSWESEKDLIDCIDGAKTYLTTFFRKSVNGLLFSPDERCDGDYFDPAYTQVHRILCVNDQQSAGDSTKSTISTTLENEDTVSPADRGIILDKSHPDFDNGTGRQFLIKWLNMSYTECTYEFERDLILHDIEYKDQLKQFLQRNEKPKPAMMKSKFKRGDEEKRRLYKIFGDNVQMSDKKREQEASKYKKSLEAIVFENGGQLRDYQAEGVAWMMRNFVNNRGSILADEMGLGKTIQTAAFINQLATKLGQSGPYLIVAPLSTLAHWYREFDGWTNLNTIVYHGSADDRRLIRELEVAYECDRPPGYNSIGLKQFYLKKCVPNKATKTTSPWMAQVIVTTPEMLCADDYGELTVIPWTVVVVDEAHRLKNHNSKFAVNLRDARFKFEHKVLLTGTPIQNDVGEFWTLLNVIQPEEFKDCDEFLNLYGDMKSKETIDQLHDVIRDYILRRLKEDVEKSVPPKEETLIEVELTISQKQYYRALYEKNVKFLHKNKKKALDGPSLNNLAMQLRKCCNHLFLLNGVEVEIRNKALREKENDKTAEDDKVVDERTKQLKEGDLLVNQSGKLVLLDKLLPRLKENGHRVLMFSQFKIMLDVLEDYFTVRQMKFERIDGSITGKKRQQAIDRFQSPVTEGKEQPFVMLLSTCAGGVGINLTAADTCIIFDSDWNPQNDLQAQARCHRIGQTKSVKVYRLLTRKTYEMQMFHMSSLKMGLDQAVLQGLESGDGKGNDKIMTKEEVEKLLRHGAYDIFNEEKSGTAEAESNDFIQQDIDSILERRSCTVIHENTGSKSNAAGGTFSKARFSASSSAGDQQKVAEEDVDIEDPEFWKKMVGEPVDEGLQSDLPAKRRKRTLTTYSEVEYDKRICESMHPSDINDEDGDYEDGNPSTDDDSFAEDEDFDLMWQKLLH